ncbi:Ank3 [Symbiodinium necroappetens]|uniref:Ank3 protein n=1 Tax=Symbiodinium necroappetens TaxID=1628268 RepID=A0A813CC28_9DINO|nr:Ank3 [Symbiodinium necroappetens]
MVKVQKSYSIKDVKSRMWAVCELNPYVLHLYFHGSPLKDDVTLEELGHPEELQGTRTRYQDEAGLQLLEAAKAGDFAGAVSALEAAADPNFFEGEDGLAPVHAAAQCNTPQLLQFLLELKAFSEQRTRSDGMTPLHCAARSSSVEALQILLRLDATVDRQDYNSWAPLHHAVDAGQLSLVEVLLEARAPIDQLTTCWAPLHFAVVKGYTKASHVW